MLKRQWEELKAQYSAHHSGKYYRKDIPTGEVKAQVRTGKNAGKTGFITAIGGDRASFVCDDGAEEDGVYAKYILFDDKGFLDDKVRDMLGAPIEPGAWVAYSQPTNTSHTLEIGLVRRVTDAGTLIVRPRVRDGHVLDKQSPNYSLRDTDDRKVNNYRAIKIPTDPARMMLAIFTDFESIHSGQFD
jgi:hypothetical protein